MRSLLLPACLITCSLTAPLAAEQPLSFDTVAKPLFAKYCLKCHRDGKKAKGETDLSTLTAENSSRHFEMLESAAERIAEQSMPPEDQPQPSDQERQQFQAWYQTRFIDSVQPRPADFRPRRLCVAEYRNTLRSMFGFDLEVAVIEAEQTITEKSLVVKLMQTDPPGDSGFRNDTRNSPLTTVLWNHYAYLADAGLEELFSPKRRAVLEKITGPIPPQGLTAEHAERLVRSFLPRAFRRPLPEKELARSVRNVVESKNLEAALKLELKAALMSPSFLYRGSRITRNGLGQQAVDHYELAERLSYFLWADMPDETLFALAAKEKLDDPKVLVEQVQRMIASPKSRSLSEDFAEQWLTLNEIAKISNNPPQAEAFRSQPLDFMHYLFVEDRPLIELIDSRVAFANRFTAGFYGQDSKQMKRYRKPKGIEVEIVPNQKLQLVHTQERGGILTMPGVLGMNRGPVIRGVWILERILGEHLPEPPPDVGQIPPSPPGKKLTFRQRFEMHRSKPTCAICHNKIDPLGFALQHYNGMNYRKDPKVDASGRLPSGEKFEDFAGLKHILTTSQREQVIRNVVERTLAYAVCRRLELYDRPTVNAITQEMLKTDGTYQDLVLQIVHSLPFRETVFH